MDLDYKALSNAGTWFIGRLQTARDQQRVLDGLAGAAAAGGTRFDRKKMGQILAGLGNRVFLMNNVHEDQPVLFESRWAMSYLRGPLTRDQIRKLLEPLRPALAAGPAGGNAWPAGAAPGAAAPAAARPLPAPRQPRPAQHGPADDHPGDHPVLPPAAPGAPEGAATLVYEPRCLGIAKVYYADAKADLAAEREVAVLADVDPQLSRPLWEEAAQAQVRDRDLETVPEPGALFAGVPAALADPKSYAAWGADFREWLYRSQALRLLRSPSLELSSNPGESERISACACSSPAASAGTSCWSASASATPPGSPLCRSASGAPSRRWTAKRSRPSSRKCRPPFPSA